MYSRISRSVGSQSSSGLALARSRAVAVRATLVLTSRAGLPDPDARAEHLAEQGVRVRLAIVDEQIAAETGYAEKSVHRKKLYELGIPIHRDLMLLAVRRQGERLRAIFRNDLTDAAVELDADQVVVERGSSPLDEVYRELRDQSRNLGVTDIKALLALEPQPEADGAGFVLYRIGDAVSSRSLHSALLDAYRIALPL